MDFSGDDSEGAGRHASQAGGSAADSRALLNGLLMKVATGDRATFSQLYHHTSSKLFGVCLRMLRDTGAAEEVLQDFYISVWRQADRFDPGRASALTWLTTMARNRAIDRLRQHREAPLDEGAEETLVDDAPTPAEHTEDNQERLRLASCIDQLTPQHGHAIREAFFSGATYSELAARVNVPLGTMKSWIRRSLVLLKACLEQ